MGVLSRRVALCGPVSAAHRYALHRARDDSGGEAPTTITTVIPCALQRDAQQNGVMPTRDRQDHGSGHP